MSPATAAPAVARRALRGGALAASAFALTGLLTPTASAAPAHAQALDRRRCASVAKDWPVQGDQRTECAELTVPLDYTKPQGRTITIVVSRTKATWQHPGEPLVFGAGGPGTEIASALYGLLGSRLGTLTARCPPPSHRSTGSPRTSPPRRRSTSSATTSSTCPPAGSW